MSLPCQFCSQILDSATTWVKHQNAHNESERSAGGHDGLQDTSHGQPVVRAAARESGIVYPEKEKNQGIETLAAAGPKETTARHSGPKPTRIVILRLPCRGRKRKAQEDAGPPPAPLSKKNVASIPDDSTPLSVLSDSRFTELGGNVATPDLPTYRERVLQGGIHAGSSSPGLLRDTPRSGSSMSHAEDALPARHASASATRHANYTVPSERTGPLRDYSSNIRATTPFSRAEQRVRELNRRNFNLMINNISNAPRVAAGTMPDGSDSFERIEQNLCDLMQEEDVRRATREAERSRD